MSTINTNALGITYTSDASGTLYLQTLGSNAVSIDNAQRVVINSSAASTSPSTGAFVVTGGVGIGGDLYVGGNITIGDGVGSDVLVINSQFTSGTQLKTTQSDGNTLAISAYDVNDATYRDLITLTASNTPTLSLTSNGVGSIDNMTIGGITPAAGTFSTLTATAGSLNNVTIGAVTPAAGTFSQVTRSGNISAAAWTTSGIGYIGVASTFTDTTSTGTVPITTINTFNQHTLASSNSVTVTDAATLYIANGPTAGTNTTITNRNALYIAAGISRFLGPVTINGDNVNTTISPTGTGTVTISPAGALTVNPATLSSMDNVTIGGNTAASGTFTQLTRSGNISSTAWTTAGIGFRGITSTFTDTSSTGTVPITTVNTFNQHTLASSNAITVTDAATVYIANGPAQGTNTTITNRNALYVAAGISRFLGAVTINGANVNTTISPTGTGTVTISPVGALTINPTASSNMDNVVIGNSTPVAGTFSTLTANGATNTAAFLTPTTALSSTAWTTNGINLRLQSRTYTDTNSSGTVASNYVNVINQPTLASTNSVTVTNAANLFVGTVASTGNTTITTAYAIWANGRIFATDIVSSVGATSANTGAFTTLTTSTSISATDRSTQAATTSFVRDQGGFATQVIFTTGAATWTVPTGITKIKVTVVGAGGGGGGVSAVANAAGAGGGGGGMSVSYYTGLTPGNTLNYSVGTGGTAGANTGGTGGTGGNTTVSSGTQTITTLQANGGVGGGGATTNTTTVGGAGGAAGSGPTGAVLMAGGTGGTAIGASLVAGTGSNGPVGGGGGQGKVATTGAGSNATNFGAGGGGALGATANIGGTGSNGIVIIEY